MSALQKVFLSQVNRSIRDTFAEKPKSLPSVIRITAALATAALRILAESLDADTPGRERFATSIVSVTCEPSPDARVMVRIVEIERPQHDAFDEKSRLRKEV